MKPIVLIATFLVLLIPLSAQPESERGELHWKSYDKGLRLFVGGTLAEPRRTSRLFYWYPEPDRSGGEIFVSYGCPEWTEKIGEAMQSLKSGLTWRLGSSFWTVLDTNLPLNIGGTRLAPGLYYLGVNRSPDGKDWSLAILSPQTIRRQRIDAYETHLRPVPVEKTAPLQFEEAEWVTERLRIFLNAAKEDPRKVSLEINFGPYRLSTPIQVETYPQVGQDPEAGR